MPLSPSQERFLLVLAGRIVPESAGLSSEEKEEFLRILQDALGSRPPALQRQFGLFLGVLRWAPFFCFLAPFDRLSPERQDAVLRWFQDGPIGLFRKGFWGLKAMVYMGYYAREGVGETLGYTPSMRAGNEKLRKGPRS